MTPLENTRKSRVTGRIIASLLAVLIGGVCLAQSSESRTAPEPIERRLNRLRKLITNAKVKLQHDGSMGFARDGQTVNASPAWACCAANLKRIEKNAVAIQGMFLQLEDCYEGNEDADSQIAVRLSMSDLQGLARAVQAFADSPTQDQAEAAMGSITRAFLHLADTSIELPECGELIDPADLGTSETKPSGEEDEDEDENEEDQGDTR